MVTENSSGTEKGKPGHQKVDFEALFKKIKEQKVCPSFVQSKCSEEEWAWIVAYSKRWGFVVDTET